jgi:dTMP kinase
MPKKGLFITLEGGEGTGKSTQGKLLQAALAAAGVDVVATREPGGTEQAERIRNLLLQRDAGNFDALTEALLMMAARREHLVNKIWPALEKGQWVVSDRFADSTRAFQGYGMGLDQAVVEKIYALVAGDFHPDLTFIFDIDPAQGLARSLKRHAAGQAPAGATEDRYERMGLPFHERLRKGFLDIARANPSRCVIIDAAQDIGAVHRQVLKTLAARTGVSCKEAQNG